uniref:Cytochrome b-c1 complex subunit 7 n=1 Tax=Leptocylindrus danicus TaxID=163516 RepID=A0A7S2PS81_9STRA|mmetsp:Transcript_8987/g.13385  ORF Transcript_8987/g.13385 Transcript_8987/m.13385 type:complete len:114 (+) Transcript_8987:48-389(+)|eukprot:CAMPEP_0116017990 /NCGR_PEP_ID=MMETSP0321-20121206/8384_1 /TAXON_ID=163516 /ORGANISM="Leptocylindrus danicus var. danicus, Strain B650" /LENGTH=113 /DNA_ID=CAMNT_0003488303 /DNA_START=33 /DNA_END=374 /DNA_ORIENTATION=+
MALALVNKAISVASRQYGKMLGPSLNSFGLTYEDLLNENDYSVAEALSLADKDLVTGRTRRAKRAIDLSYKRKDLQDYAPNMALDPFKSELGDEIEALQDRDEEFIRLNMHMS